MSRTTRRKTGKYSHSWYCTGEDDFERMVSVIEIEKWEPGRHRHMVAYYQRWTLDSKTYAEYYAKQTAKYHGEQRPGYYSPPSDWVNRNCNRPLRRKVKEQMHYALTYDLWDDTVLEPYIKFAGWYWF